MNPALLQKGSNSFRTDSEIKDHEGGAFALLEQMLHFPLNFQIHD